ncbi:MAG: hypothetical protein NZ480_04895 [Bdellovibrionaceae bacterium]|nr:hypothetical protein [Pseudobdellovibrionaceae bacterium]MDW8191109.1 hypothetical protein [Pseudobdellovibrionaceae bacterium]
MKSYAGQIEGHKKQLELLTQELSSNRGQMEAILKRIPELDERIAFLKSQAAELIKT